MQRYISEQGGFADKTNMKGHAVKKSILAATCGFAVLLWLIASPSMHLLFAQENAGSGSNTETIHYDSSGSSISAYVARPKTAGKHPAVILVHDTQGLSDAIRGTARQFADAGFIALAPDLLSRVGGTTTPQQAQGEIRDLSLSTPVQDLRAAFEFLQKEPGVDPDKISAVGFGWGGWRSLTLAASQPGLYRTVVYSGVTPSDGLQNIQTPVLAHYGQLDFRITGNAILTEDLMTQMGKKFTYYIYPKTEHAFFNESGARYDAESAKLAWQRTLDFLRSPS